MIFLEIAQLKSSDDRLNYMRNATITVPARWVSKVEFPIRRVKNARGCLAGRRYVRRDQVYESHWINLTRDNADPSIHTRARFDYAQNNSRE